MDEAGNPIKEKNKSDYKLTKLKAEIKPELEMRKVSCFEVVTMFSNC